MPNAVRVAPFPALPLRLQAFGSRGRIASVLSLAAMLWPSLGATADELAPLERQSLVKVEEPLPEESSLVAPPEPLPQTNTSPPVDSLLIRSAREAEIVETVDRWLVAWWQQEVDEYLAFYADDFAPPEDLDRAAWEEQRRRRLAAPAFISIRIEPPEVIALGGERYRARFIQHYRSDTYEDTVLKELDLTREEGRWKIQREESRLPILSTSRASL